MKEKKESLKILQECIDELEHVTPEEFAQSLKDKSLEKEEFPNRNYADTSFIPVRRDGTPI